jgi:hypothetical protein
MEPVNGWRPGQDECAQQYVVVIVIEGKTVHAEVPRSAIKAFQKGLAIVGAEGQAAAFGVAHGGTLIQPHQFGELHPLRLPEIHLPMHFHGVIDENHAPAGIHDYGRLAQVFHEAEHDLERPIATNNFVAQIQRWNRDPFAQGRDQHRSLTHPVTTHDTTSS